MSHMKRLLTVLCLGLCIILVISGCGGEKPSSNIASNELKKQSDSTDNKKASSSYKNIGDFFEAWAVLSANHLNVIGELGGAHATGFVWRGVF